MFQAVRLIREVDRSIIIVCAYADIKRSRQIGLIQIQIVSEASCTSVSKEHRGAYISRFGVCKDYRGRNVGSILLDAAEHFVRAKEPLCDRFLVDPFPDNVMCEDDYEGLSIDALRSIYKHLGFHDLRTESGAPIKTMERFFQEGKLIRKRLIRNQIRFFFSKNKYLP